MTQSVFNLTSLNGKNGFAIDGIYQGDQARISVASVGDINGDGKNDIIIGAEDINNYAEQAYVSIWSS